MLEAALGWSANAGYALVQTIVETGFAPKMPGSIGLAGKIMLPSSD
ncbi:hypothetical protein [Methylomonas fluvii]|nr:hypothetical protein [Methylomonas fluvii]